MSMKQTIVRGLARAEFQMKRKSPELLLAGGIVTFIGTVVIACRRTTRMDEVIRFHNERMDKISQAEEIYQSDPENELEFNEKDRRREVVKTYALDVVHVGRLYAPAIGMGALSIGCFLASYRIMRARYIGVVALVKSIQSAFDAYRARVVQEYGAEVDRHLRYGTEYSTKKITTVDENGNKVKTEETEANTNTDTLPVDDTCRVFGPENKQWDPNPNFSMSWLRGRQNMMNDLLHSRGHVFLNEVYDALGFEHTPIGAVVGWIDGEGDDMIDFFGEIGDSRVRNFVNGKDNVILLTFNHQGVIWDRLDPKGSGGILPLEG